MGTYAGKLRIIFEGSGSCSGVGVVFSLVTCGRIVLKAREAAAAPVHVFLALRPQVKLSKAHTD